MVHSELSQTERLFCQLETAFQKQVTDFTFHEKEAMFCSFSRATHESNDSLLSCITGSIVFPGFRLCVMFEPRHPRLLTGVLQLHIRFGLRADARAYPIYAVLPYLDPDDFSCYTLSAVTTPEQLEAGMQYLFRAFLRHYDALSRLCGDPERLAQMDKAFCDDVTAYFQDDVFSRCARHPEQLSVFLGWYSDALTRRLCSNAYLLFLLGNFSAARRAYRNRSRYSRLLAHEQRLYAFLQNLLAENRTYTSLPRALWFFVPETAAEKQRTERAQSRSLALGAALTYALLCVLTQGAYTVFCRVFAQHHLLVLFPSRAGLFVFALLPALLLCILLRHSFYHWFAGTEEAALLESDHMPGSAVRTWGSRAVITACLVFSLFYANNNIVFDAAGVSDNRAFGIDGSYTRYEQVVLQQTDSQYLLCCGSAEPFVLNRMADSNEIRSRIVPILTRGGSTVQLS
ncbi:MAG: hypothetical protein ACI3X2_08180 [Butyricicoccus porcorum]